MTHPSPSKNGHEWNRVANPAHLSAIIESAADAIISVDEAERIILFNKGAEQIFGYRADEVLGQSLALLLPQHNPDRYRQRSHPFAAEATPARFILDSQLPIVGRRKNGAQFPAEMSIIKTTVNGETMFTAILRDATQREETEAALSESEAKHRALLSAIPDLMFINRRDGTYLSYHTPALTDLLVVHPSRLLGKHLADVLPADVAQASMRHIERALETGEIQLYNYQLPINGVVHHFEARMVASGDDEVLTIVRDISEQARLEQMKSDFINRAAHELRTPLATILMMVDLIEEGGSEAEIKQYWQVLHSELERQRELVEELLTMGRLESDMLQLNIAPLDLSSILLEALGAGAPLAKAKSIRLDAEITPNLPPVNGDKSNLRQAFVNLLNNAVKFTPENGKVTLRAMRRNGGLTVQVCDTGIGIPPEDLPHLFGRFFRASNATQNEIPGSGVGLYLVKAIVEKFGGNIRVESQVNVGTTFEVWLPVAGSSEAFLEKAN